MAASITLNFGARTRLLRTGVSRNHPKTVGGRRRSNTPIHTLWTAHSNGRTQQ